MNTKYLLQLIFKALAFSFALSFILGSAYYIKTVKFDNYIPAVPSIIAGSLLLTLILTLMEFAVLFFQYHSIYTSTIVRLILFFGGTVGFLTSIYFRHLSESNIIFYAITGISFLGVQVILYVRMLRKYPPSAKMG
ncbi:hypothetical protein [Mucilaginibacter agri]|uniref:Uncharacterized protein n=1 Tax=Mucilaginibacter agri TaxID=2695265 RepID=A0A965ZFU4_9SPHI|nr:hypothetical protein [Mucilaginibacter agri]NCD68971.1 hypothetical protein [Mucilaginibacter agri]